MRVWSVKRVWLCGGCRQEHANLRTSVSLSGVPGGYSMGALHHPFDQTKLKRSLEESDLSRLVPWTISSS